MSNSLYPAQLDSFINPTGSTTQDTPGTAGHAGQHGVANDAIAAIETTLGTTAGTSVLKNFVAGDFASRINAGGTLQQTITGNIGTPTLIFGTDTTGDMYYKSAGGTVTRLPIGVSGQF